ncbi:GntR family transcriptional regulator [Saccharopolyspora spinosa]|uniref:FCD domain-containing protein n=2 Tax=Saccharopolyspora spinosa TaxID=60894 RepID=A0A2N3Y286_SACSN|nr:GntR family transcriptional regulator [Saccharopolyspora spinosa]PKW17029.1 FCD domain-containing protein [Saccharopolyspora spinosa]
MIAARLRKSIRRGELLPGTRLVQEQLAGEMEVSRIPLREALHALAAEGLIEVQPQRGMIVAELSHGDITELFELRLQLEPNLADEIVRGCRERDIDELQVMADQMREKCADAAGRAFLNYQFHRRIYDLSKAAAGAPLHRPAAAPRRALQPPLGPLRARSLLPGDLVLTSCLWYYEPADSRPFAAALARSQAAGLIVWLLVTRAMPAGLVAACAELDLPLR